jgi:hypothetical protein
MGVTALPAHICVRPVIWMRKVARIGVRKNAYMFLVEKHRSEVIGGNLRMILKWN